MTSEIYLTNLQIEKFNKTGELILTKNVFKKPNYKIKLTNNQIKKLKNGETVKINAKEGGFIPLIPLIAGVTGLISAGSSVYNAINNKKTNEKLIEQKERQNSILEKQNKEGKPIQINTLKAESEFLKGNALTLKKDYVKNGGSLNGKNMDLLIKSSKNFL